MLLPFDLRIEAPPSQYCTSVLNTIQNRKAGVFCRCFEVFNFCWIFGFVGLFFFFVSDVSSCYHSLFSQRMTSGYCSVLESRFVKSRMHLAS